MHEKVPGKVPDILYTIYVHYILRFDEVSSSNNDVSSFLQEVWSVGGTRVGEVGPDLVLNPCVCRVNIVFSTTCVM